MEITYIPSKTGRKFHATRNKFVRALMGPVGSGKSVTCVIELILIARTQEPDASGIRRTRFAIIRNTYRELLDTTIYTFFTWIDKDSGHYSALNMTFFLEQELDDGTTMHAEFLFRALDKPDDVKKLLSLEITAAWVNEARELPKQVIDMLQTRVGRYPARALHVMPTWHGIIMDTNPPDNDHWWYKLFEEGCPDNHILLKQPSGLSEAAENIENLPANYYTNMMAGKVMDWINVYVKGQYGFIADGRSVYPEYNDELHYVEDDIKPDPRLPIYIGLDFGLTPAALFGQLQPSGRFIIFDELVTFDMGAVNFGKLLKQHIRQNYKNYEIEVYGDPAGDTRAQTDEQTPYMILQAEGISAIPTHTNDFTIRREVVVSYLTRLDFTGKPAMAITPGAPSFRKACAGGYQYKRVQVSGEERFQDKPYKNKFSHIAEAGQYMILGAVGDDRVIGSFSSKPLDYSAIDRAIV